MDIDTLIADLERVLPKATPGPWRFEEDGRPSMEWNRHIMSSPTHAVCFMAHGNDPARDEATATLIALCSPDNIAALIAEVKRLREDAAAERELWLDVRGYLIAAAEGGMSRNPNSETLAAELLSSIDAARKQGEQ